MGLMDRTNVVDLDHLDAYTGGDPAVRSEILSIFQHQAEMWVRLLDTQNGDEGFADGVHTIKGAARGIGAWPLAEVCEGIERKAAAGDLSLAEKAVGAGQIREALDQVLSDISVIEHKSALQSLRTSS